ncbi:hypothetical protein [Parageobacillus thermoglucosidasius]|uniref:hypothetical protein n=1 Tax=Parageobacillus thermoglucosidasius TaxID=1426 RepID=UPI001E5A4DF8|nr:MULTISPECIES: hypothetical protein [Parageobacillus]
MVERIWGWLKESVIANWFHANRKELRESIVFVLGASRSISRKSAPTHWTDSYVGKLI